MNFESIIGQTEVINGLKKLFSNDRVGHAYIFCGPKGIGKKTIASEFSALLICENCKDGESCNDCTPCRLFDNRTNPDFQIIEQSGPSIGVEEIRRIQGDIIIRPLYSKRKVYIVDNAEAMTAQAQNCLLKILEEPPSYAVIIMLTANSDSLIETIRSRAVKINFKKNTKNEVHEYLSKKLSDKNSIDFLASYSDGVIGKAIELSESREFVVLREKTIDIIIELSTSKLVKVFETYKFFEDEKKNIDAILDIMLLLYRDYLIMKKAGNENLLINSDKKDIILRSMTRFSIKELLHNMEVIERTRRNIKQNANYQLNIEVMLIELQEERN